MLGSNPPGIACASSVCSYAFTSGTPVTLTATPDWKSLFSGWSGACSGTGACDLTPLVNTGVTATFTMNRQATILGHTISEYASLQDAYAAAIEGSIIAAHVYNFSESLTLSRPINVFLDFGKGDMYLSGVGYTTLQGALTIEQGSAIVSNLIID